MDWQDALEVVVKATKCERYRTLCSDSSPHPDKIQTYRALMLKKAMELAGPPPAPMPPLPATLDAMKAVKACPHRSRDSGCGCNGSRCALGKGKAGIVSTRECLVCVGLAIGTDGQAGMRIGV